MQSKAVELTAARFDIMWLSRRAGAGLITLDLFVNLLAGSLPVVFTIAAALVVGKVPGAVQGGIGSAAWNSLLADFIVAAAAFIGQQIVAPLRDSVGELLARQVDGRVIDEIMFAATSTVSLGPLEDTRIVTDLRTAARELENWILSPGQACAGQIALLARYAQLTGYAVVVGVVFSWLAALGLVAATMLFRYGSRGGLRKYAEARIARDPEEIRNDYLRGLAIDSAAAKEIRVFGLIGWLTDYWRNSYLDWLKPLQAVRRRIYLWPFIWFSLWGLAVSASSLALMGYGASMPNGGLDLTRFIMVITASLAALNLGDFYPESDLPTTVGMQAYNSTRKFLRAVAAAEPGSYSDDGPRERSGTDVPALTTGIHFDRIGFHYPGESRTIFDELDFTIPAGQCTALVGVNGAGKTTLVKLLARLYEPTTGAVRADGIDIRNYPVDGWRARLAVIFQDFARYEISAADNVGFGAVSHIGDRAGIRSVIEAVGLAEALDALPHGIDTVLAKHVADGADLSGGLWHRVAIARALFALRHGSPILVLDEPTASLDVRAETRFFQEFARLARGATTLLISHRFSTVRQADLIVVLENGRVVEQGSHAALMARGGRYAHLFSLQADRFTDNTNLAGTGEDETVEMPL